jgi:hypothetical protein
MRYMIMAPDVDGYVLALMDHPTLFEALRLAWRLFRRPRAYGVMIKVERAWIEQHCTPVEAGRCFDAPLGMEK